jgi:hypothetical protein
MRPWIGSRRSPRRFQRSLPRAGQRRLLPRSTAISVVWEVRLESPMVGRAALVASQAIAGVVEPKVVNLLALPEPMPPRAQRRRTLGKPVLPVEPRDRSNRSSEPLLSSSWPSPLAGHVVTQLADGSHSIGWTFPSERVAAPRCHSTNLSPGTRLSTGETYRPSDRLLSPCRPGPPATAAAPGQHGRASPPTSS